MLSLHYLQWLNQMCCIFEPAPLSSQSLLKSCKRFLILPSKHSHAFPTHASAGLLQHPCVIQELQQSRQPQLLNPLAWSSALQGLGAASLMLVAALLWSSLRRTSLSSQRQHAAV